MQPANMKNIHFGFNQTKKIQKLERSWKLVFNVLPAFLSYMGLNLYTR